MRRVREREGGIGYNKSIFEQTRDHRIAILVARKPRESGIEISEENRRVRLIFEQWGESIDRLTSRARLSVF